VTVLLFLGLALLVPNLFDVPASTSMTAVGAVAGLGLATGTLDWGAMGRVVSRLAGRAGPRVPDLCGRRPVSLSLPRRLVRARPLGGWGRLPRPLRPRARRREVAGTVLVVAIACYMAFSAGASNVANAVAPLVGSGAVSTDAGVLLAAGAIGVRACTIARRTLDTVGNDLTDLPLLAALIVETVAATLISALSAIGIPASLAVSATMCIVGLG
jgi:PiT family inorganic phosphate transporter